MKKLYLFFLLLFPFFLHAQITITADDFPQVGDVFIAVNCVVPPAFDIGSPGANQTYDFSMLTPIDTFTSSNFVSPNGTGGSSEFPNATLAASFDDGFVYYQQTSNEVFLLGFYVDTSANGNGQYAATHYNPAYKVFEIPSTYNTSFTSMSGYAVTIADDSGDWDSIRTSVITEDDVLFDGYGTVITPDGSFEALRQRKFTTTTVSLEAYFFGAWTPLFASTNSDTSYNWLGDNNLNLASVSIIDGEITNIYYSLNEVQLLPPVADFLSDELGGGTIDFTDNSSNNPSSWLWDFGDGNTSTIQNPQHTYSTSGDFNVCLTATNAAGSNTACEIVGVILTDIDDAEKLVNVDIFPNPATDILMLKLENTKQEMLAFQLMNPLGQFVINREVASNGIYSIDVESFTAGMYYYTFLDSDGVVRKRGSLIKNNFE